MDHDALHEQFPGYAHPAPQRISRSHSERDTMCPICASNLESFGETLAAFGDANQTPVEFGKVVSFECGHRMHRDCAVQWINTAMEPTCPICRRLTSWTPSLAEQTNLRNVMSQGWKTLGTAQQNTILVTWIVAGVACITDPLGFLLVSSIFLLLTPPMFFDAAAAALLFLKKKLVSDETIPGFRILVLVGFATLVTMLVSITADSE